MHLVVEYDRVNGYLPDVGGNRPYEDSRICRKLFGDYPGAKRSLGKVRSIDIARALNFSKPSISRAVRLLKADAYITVDSDGWIELEPKGEAIAAKILERHELITQWLIMLGVSPEVASQDACKMEHDLSAETFELLKAHIQAEHPNLS